MPHGGSGRPARRRAPRAVPRAAPVHQDPPPDPAQSGGGSTIAQGMAFGTGSAVAHRGVDSIMGPRTVQHEVIGNDACNIHSKAFQDCMNSYGSDISKCQFYMDMLAECRKNSGAGAPMSA